MNILFVHLDTGQDGLMIFQGIRAVARRLGWRVMSRPWYGPALTPLGSGTDGVIAQIGLPALGEHLLRTGLPVVNCDGSIPEAFPFPCVRHDARQIGRQAARHLLDLGLRRIGYIGPAERSNAAEQAAAVAAEAAARGAAGASWLWPGAWPHWGDSGAGGSFAPVEELISRLGTPMGLVVWGVTHPVLVCDRVRARWPIPGAVAVVAAARDPLLHGGDEGISAVATRPRRIGETAAGMLADLIAGRQVRDRLVQPGGVVAAASTSVLAVAHPSVAAALRHIHAQDGRPVTVDEVAAAVSTSRRTLQRLFRQVLGHGVREAALRMRAQRAAALLADEGMSLKSAAHRLRFSSGSHLARTLRRYHGPLPG